MRRDRPDQPIAPERPSSSNRHDLQVFSELVLDLQVARPQHPLDPLGVQRRLGCELVHPRHELAQRRRHHEVLASVQERLHRRRHHRPRPPEHVAHRLVGQVEVLLGARQHELLLDDPLVEDEPRVLEPGPAQVLQRPQGVEPGEERRGQPVPGPVQPDRRRTGQDPYAVLRPDRVPVADPFDVVPHPVPVDDPAAGPSGDPPHPPVDVRRHPSQASRGGANRSGQADRTRSRLPPIPPLATMTAPADSSNSPTGSRDVATPRGRWVGARRVPRTPLTTSRCQHEVVDPMPEGIPQPTSDLEPPSPTAHERLTDPGPVPQVMWKRGTELPCPPPAVAAFGPADDREDLDGPSRQPTAHLPGREIDIRPAHCLPQWSSPTPLEPASCPRRPLPAGPNQRSPSSPTRPVRASP
jgi:hypothetical protein